MTTPDIEKYASGSIAQLVHDLNDHYYATTRQLCEDAGALALNLRVTEIDKSTNTEIYTMLTVNFTKHLRQYQEQKTETILPYVLSLLEKEKNNHNCLNCTHNCQINHSMHLAFLKESHDFAKGHVQRLKNVVVPMNSENHSELYQSLRITMFLIEKSLLESTFLEETFLIPGILKLQKAINVLAPV